jgi:hypothetical protein
MTAYNFNLEWGLNGSNPETVQNKNGSNPELNDSDAGLNSSNTVEGAKSPDQVHTDYL